MKILIISGALLIFAVSAQAYEVVLTNGKSIQGTKVSEDENMIVIQDATGVRMNIKKSNIDASKTEAVNQQAEIKEEVMPVQSSEAQKSEPAKPARKVTKEELEKLREKYDLGEGTFSEKIKQEANEEDSEEGSDEDSEDSELEGDEEEEGDEFSEKSEAEWKQESQSHRDAVNAAQEEFARLNQECQDIKVIAAQSHMLKDEHGNELPVTEAAQEVCELADSSRAKLEEERLAYSEFASDAKLKGIPPGWLRDKDGREPDE